MNDLKIERRKNEKDNNDNNVACLFASFFLASVKRNKM